MCVYNHAKNSFLSGVKAQDIMVYFSTPMGGGQGGGRRLIKRVAQSLSEHPLPVSLMAKDTNNADFLFCFIDKVENDGWGKYLFQKTCRPALFQNVTRYSPRCPPRHKWTRATISPHNHALTATPVFVLAKRRRGQPQRPRARGRWAGRSEWQGCAGPS